MSDMRPAPMLDASVIVCTHNRCDTLVSCLRSLQAMRVPAELSWEVIVVDNNSTDATRTVVEQLRRGSASNVRYVFEPQQGKSRALNAGVRAARGRLLAFTDDDVRVDPDWLPNLLRTFDEFDCAGVGGRVVADWQCEPPAWLSGGCPRWLQVSLALFDFGDRPVPLVYPEAPFGNNMAFRRDALERHGTFRTDLGPGSGGIIGGEDTELGQRMMRAGETLFYQPAATVHHRVEADRAQKRYFRSWYFKAGKMWMRMQPVPPDATFYFGVPRYLFRELAGHAMRSLVTRDPSERFRQQLSACWAAGRVAEVRRAAARRGHGVAVRGPSPRSEP